MAKKAEEQKAVVPQEQHGGDLVIVQDQIPEFLKGQTVRGNENVTSDDLVIPRLEVLQAISPQCTEGDPEYNKNCRPGDLMNSVTGQIYGREVFVVPVSYEKLFLVWLDRKKGGGFRGAFRTEDEAKAKAEEEGGKAQGFEVADTPTHLCLLVNRDVGSVDEIMVAMPRTKAKISRQWNSMIRMAGGDRFSRVYRIASQSEKNAKGTFFNLAVAQAGFPAAPLFKRAEALYEQVKSGKVRTMDTTGFNPGGDNEDHEDAEM